MKIFLIGFMGSGKTHWAQRIADKMGWDWIDLDQQIEKATNMLVREIFATEGEAFFRGKERDTLQQLGAVENLVIATGGGTPCFHENMQWMNDNGITIWLDPNLDLLKERLLRKKHKRPLISALADDEVGDFIQQKGAERYPFYSQAQHRLQDDDISLHSFIKIIQVA